MVFVALLAEGVDRNILPPVISISYNKSPSSRRAWIEILANHRQIVVYFCRPPRGGRG